IRSTVAALKTPSPRIANCDALGARLAALRDSLPEVAPAEEFGALDIDIDLDAIEPEAPEAPVPEAPDAEAPPANPGASLADELSSIDVAGAFGDLASVLGTGEAAASIP